MTDSTIADTVADSPSTRLQETTPDLAAVQHSAAAHSSHHDSYIGCTIGPMRIIEKIGEGGMGVVYKAKHETTGQWVAIKVLLPSFSRAPNMVKRFFNEAKAARAIKHPGTVEIYDSGYDDNRRAYLAMEYVEGESLRVMLERESKLAPACAKLIVRQIAEVLAAAHASGVVHRDLKPDNILIAADSSAPGGIRVKLLDFGIAKVATAGTQLTRLGDVLGTPLYMAPEQCRGDTNVDHRADLYALGCLLYALLCGRPPFEAASLGDMLTAHCQATPPSPTLFVPDLDPGLEEHIISLLAKEPARRPQSAAAVIARLDEFERSSQPAQTATATATDDDTRAQADRIAPTPMAYATPMLPRFAQRAPALPSSSMAGIPETDGPHHWRSPVVIAVSGLLMVLIGALGLASL